MDMVGTRFEAHLMVADVLLESESTLLQETDFAEDAFCVILSINLCPRLAFVNSNLVTF